LELFGYSITKSLDDTEKTLQTFSTKEPETGAVEIESGANFAGLNKYILDLDQEFDNEKQRIDAYRVAAKTPHISTAIDDIVNEAVVNNSNSDVVKLDLDNIKFSVGIKNKIQDEFTHINNLLNFNDDAANIFRRWYIDGKINYHKIVDEKKISNGIVEMRYLDPRRIKKVRDNVKNGDGKVIKTNEYYVYSLSDPDSKVKDYSNQVALEISPDMIAHANSGIVVEGTSVVESYLQKALKPLNQLTNMEDSLVVYRVSRAPERRIFYIDVGNLPKTRAEQYVKSIIGKYKNKVTYDATTGSFTNNKNQMSMLEDIWLPRREGSKGTEVSTLPGGQSLGDLEDVTYFKTNLNKALHVPLSRMESESTFNLGRSSEITRDEIKFGKFISKLQRGFGNLLLDTLKTQLLLKNIITEDDWNKFKNSFRLVFSTDAYFSELKDAEVLNARLENLEAIGEHIGRYFSPQYVMKTVLHMTEEEIKEQQDEIAEAIKDGIIKDPNKEEDF
jgi:hypothetical protein